MKTLLDFMIIIIIYNKMESYTGDINWYQVFSHLINTAYIRVSISSKEAFNLYKIITSKDIFC